jgi:hypothetical protein
MSERTEAFYKAKSAITRAHQHLRGLGISDFEYQAALMDALSVRIAAHPNSDGMLELVQSGLSKLVAYHKGAVASQREAMKAFRKDRDR